MSSIQVSEASAAITVSGTVAGYVTVGSSTPFVAGARCNLFKLGVKASGTVTFAGALAADNVTVAGVTFVGTIGAVVLGQATYSVDTGNNEAAASLKVQINAHAITSIRVLAASNLAVCTITALVEGVEGNAYTLTSTTGVRLAVTGVGFLAGGVAGGTRIAQIADLGGGGANTIGLRFLPDPPPIGMDRWMLPLEAPSYGQADCTSIVAAHNWTIHQRKQIVAVPRTTA